jgi:hypothetical protein
VYIGKHSQLQYGYNMTIQAYLSIHDNHSTSIHVKHKKINNKYMYTHIEKSITQHIYVLHSGHGTGINVHESTEIKYP